MKAKSASTSHTRKSNREQVEEKSAWLAAIVESTDDAIIGKTLDGIITSWNTGAEKIYGYQAAEVIGKSVSILIPAQLRDELPAILGKLKRGERMDHYETIRLHKNGEQINISLTISPIKNTSGELIGASAIARDITEHKLAEEQILSLAKFPDENPNPVLRISREGVLLYANKSSRSLLNRWGCEVGSQLPHEVVEVTSTVLQNGISKEIEINCEDTVYSISLTSVASAGYVNGYARDVTESKRAIEQLIKSEERFRLLFENNHSVMMLIDPHSGAISNANKAAAKFYGYSVRELCAMNINNINQLTAEEVYAERMLALKEEREYFNFLHRLSNGEIRSVEVYSAPIQVEGNTLLFSIINDITERLRAEKKVIQLKRLYATLSQVNQMIVRVKDREELFQTICDVAADFGEFILAWVGILDERSGEVKPVAAHGLDTHQWPFPIINLQREEHQQSLTSQAIRTSTVMTHENIQENEYLIRLGNAASYPYRATAVIPFRLRNKVIGIVALVSQEKGLFNDENEIRLLNEMGLDISFALENMENEKQRRQTEEALRQSEETYRGLFDHMKEGYAYCQMLFENGLAHDWIYCDVNDAFETLTGLKDAKGKRVSELIPGIRESDPQLFEIYSRVSLTGKHEKFEMFVQALQQWFSISVYSPQKEFFVAVFDIITERKKVEEAIRSRSRQLEALLHVSQSLTESLNLPDVLQRIVDRAANMLDVETSAIYLADAATLYLSASAPPLPAETPDELRKAGLKDHPHIAQALAGGQTILLSDAQSASLTTAEQEIRDNLNLRTIVYVPVTTKQNPIGVLLLGSVGKPREFTAEEINLANAVSNQAALAITNATLYQDLARQVKELETQVAERKKAEEALKQGEHVLRLFVEHSPASIAMFDRDMRYIVASQRYLIDYELPPQDLTGRSHYDVFPEIPERWKEIHRRCLAGAIEKAEEDPFPRMNGKLDWVRWEMRPWYEEPERIGGVILFSEVITERKQIQDELRQLNVELEQRVLRRTMELSQANRAKDEFLANMSHELRTPLNTVLGLSETLLEQRRGPLNEKQVQSIELISSSGQHLLGLINDILEVSKIEAGKLQLNPSAISLRELCESSLNFIKELAQKKQITVEFNNETSISRFHADPQRLKQILINLLNNAVKFTPEQGQISLQVSTNAQEDRILFSVTDTGIGIATEDLKKLFTPFTQLDSSLSRQYAGTGLGLALVQKLTELHGGSIEVESTVGQGSRFTIILPLSHGIHQQVSEMTVDATKFELKDASGLATSKEPGIILLAEDNVTNAEMVSEYLMARGYYVVSAANGEEVLEKATEFMPRLIVMDIQMPKMDGLEATRRLRSDPRFLSTPIIALTALAMPGDKERCLEAGVNEYLSKPVSLKLLVSIIERLTGSEN